MGGRGSGRKRLAEVRWQDSCRWRLQGNRR